MLHMAIVLLGLSSSTFFSKVAAFSFSPSRVSTRGGMASSIATFATTSNTSSDEKESATLSIAILGGGISGLSCASNLLSQHKQHKSRYDNLEVTLFDTGRLRPGGRCSSRLPGDKPAVIKNKSSGKFPVKNDDRSNRRACDNEDGSNNGRAKEELSVPENIQKALDVELNSNSSLV